MRQVNKEELIKIGQIILGNLLLGLAYAKWMVPRKIINGGVTSLALVLNEVTGIKIASLTNLITIALLILCWIFLGKATLLKSLISSVCYLTFFSFFMELQMNLTSYFLLDFIFACIFISLGYYFCLTAGSSTVGMDVVALIIHSKKPEFKLANIIRNLNFLVLFLGLMVYGLFPVGVGIIFSYVYAWLLGKMLAYDRKRRTRS